MSLKLPSYMTIPQGDFKGVIDGYFLVTDTYSAKPVIGSQVLSQLAYLVNNVSYYNLKEFNRQSVELFRSYGIDPNTFLLYLLENKDKILNAIGDYYAVTDLLYEFQHRAEIVDRWHNVGEFIEDVGGRVKDGLLNLTGGFGDILSNLVMKLMPVFLVAGGLWLTFAYGKKKINQSK